MKLKFGTSSCPWLAIKNFHGPPSLKNSIASASHPGKVEKPSGTTKCWGSENKGQTVSFLEAARNFRKEVARFEIIFSNSIVEAVFRSVKYNYLFYKEITTLSALEHHTGFWLGEHNEKIPHTAFDGETPLEKFNKSWSKENEIRIVVGQ